MTPNTKKPGIRSTEFWLSSGATVLGIVLASGAIPDGGMAAQIIGGILSVLASLGYTASRTQVKVAETTPVTLSEQTANETASESEDY